MGTFINVVFSDFKTKKWQLSDNKYEVIKIAMSIDKEKRFTNFEEFEKAWSEAQ